MKPEQISIETLIDHEARHIATESIERALAQQNLPLPKQSALDFHIEALLSSKPEIRDIARRRVEAKEDAYSESLRAIGIETVAVDLDL